VRRYGERKADHFFGYVISIVRDRSDNENEDLSRERLCQVARVERARHRRWLDDTLLVTKGRYGEIDVIRAAALDHLHFVLRPKAAKAVWQQIRDQLGVPGTRLEVVVEHATQRATVVRNAKELADALPRDESVTVVRLDLRVAEARERLRAFRAGQANASVSTSSAAPAALPTASEREG
jgi:hypothetical protein